MPPFSRSIAGIPGDSLRRVCLRCQVRGIYSVKGKDQRSKFGAKLRAAEEEWQAKAQKIRSGEKESMLSILESRGYVNQIAGYNLDLDLGLTHLLTH